METNDLNSVLVEGKVTRIRPRSESTTLLLETKRDNHVSKIAVEVYDKLGIACQSLVLNQNIRVVGRLYQQDIVDIITDDVNSYVAVIAEHIETRAGGTL